MAFGGVVDYLKDIFFPINCLNCDKEGSFVCNECLQTLDLSGVFCCPTCHKETIGGKYCHDCPVSFLDRHVAVTKYNEASLIGELIHSFKYQYVEELQKNITQMIDIFFEKYKLLDIDCVTFVPLHSRRFVERGFNQAEKIANIVSQKIDKPCISLLKRTRYTKPQAKFKRQERLTNLQEAFAFDNKKDFVNKNILLVDDVFTTGSTLQECAKVLKDGGVGKVVGFSLARG
ncbi:MAG: ComF family protein [Candidatus Magasanikbacteria bacterium]